MPDKETPMTDSPTTWEAGYKFDEWIHMNIMGNHDLPVHYTSNHVHALSVVTKLNPATFHVEVSDWSQLMDPRNKYWSRCQLGFGITKHQHYYGEAIDPDRSRAEALAICRACAARWEAEQEKP